MPRAAMSVATRTRTWPCLELLKGAQALVLRAIAVQRAGLDAARVELARDAVGAVFGAGKDEHGVERGVFEQRDEQRELEVPRHFVGDLRDGFRGVRAAAHLHGRGRVEKLVREPSISGESVAEKSSVWRLRGSCFHDAADVGEEAHVEHAVGFVEHEELEAGPVAVTLLHEVEQAARAGDDELDVLAQRLDLRAFADAAEDRGHAKRNVAGVGARVLLDLRRELASRREDEGANLLRADRRPRREELEHRQDERRGLAGAGLGDADDVGAAEDLRNGGGLDRRGLRVTRVFESVEEAGFETEGGERHG